MHFLTAALPELLRTALRHAVPRQSGRRVAIACGIAALSAGGLSAQASLGACATPDSIAVRGLRRLTAEAVRTDAGLVAKTELNFPALQRALRSLYQTGQFEDVELGCDPAGDGSPLTTLILTVRERPVLRDVSVTGPQAVSERSVRDKVDLLIGRPVDPAAVARITQRIDSVYEAAGFYLARVMVDSSAADTTGQLSITFRVEEGRRLAISGLRFVGNQKVRAGTIAGSMKTKPEGFWWFRKGEFDEDNFTGDLGERIPQLYATLGFVDMQIVKDTLLVDRANGKALVEITVNEGPQYKIGSFETVGNRRFSSEDLKQYYPFQPQAVSITSRVKGLIARGPEAPKGVFDRSKWDAATEKVQGAYRNEGYIYAQVEPVLDRAVGVDSQPVLNMRWQIDERNPAIVNRVDVNGNDYTSEQCIREQIFIIPGDVFNQDRLLRSWQSIGNLGFFETPLPFPEPRRVNDNGDVDIVFRVKEKRTGSVNFGASMGQGGVGFGGFIGVDQPNLFGLCKRGSLNWQYGRFFNDLNATYSDPSLRKSRVSGQVNLRRSQSRFLIGNLGQNLTTGGSIRIGLPVPGSLFSRFATTYSLERASFLGQQVATENQFCFQNCPRSNIGFEFTHDTRVDMPFPSAGATQSVTADFSGGLLGGGVNFQRYTTEMRAYAPLALLGGKKPGSQPIKLVMGLTGRMGAVVGNPGGYFFQQQFAVGGVMFGQNLRGYPEFSITPDGFDPGTDQFRASSAAAFGNAFVTMTAEVGLRVSQSLYASAFYDAGNNYRSPRQFNPTRLFRSAGFGVSTVTPLGPLGLDLAYGFDRTVRDLTTGRRIPDPKWQFHFRLGQLF
jgi:outer membrane protein insertion porin family